MVSADSIKKNIKLGLQYVARVTTLLKARPMIGGLEISDTALRFAFFNGSSWEIVGVHIPPGTLVGGKVNKKEELEKALNMLRIQILGEKKASKRKRISVIVSLSSVQIYTQIFNLPFIEGANLDRAIQLNIQMASPAGAEESYAGWQLLSDSDTKSNMRLEILSAFLGRGIVNELADALRAAYFSPLIVEPGSLSIVRAFRDMGDGFDKNKPVVAVWVTENGLEIVVVRHGHLHFSYFTSWKELRGEGVQIPIEEFRIAVVRNVHRVLNFYNSHWQEPLSEVLVSARGLQDEVTELIKKNFKLPVRALVLNIATSVGQEWFATIGAGLRGIVPRRKDKEISLLGIDAQEEFRREQEVSFSEFWRVLVPVSLGILLVTFGVASMFVKKIEENIETQITEHSPLPRELSELEKEAVDFNKVVAMMRTAESGIVQKSGMLRELITIIAANGVVMNRATLPSASSQGTFSGGASSQERIIAFKDGINSSAYFRNAELPITNIQRIGEGAYAFSMSFSMESDATE